MSSSERESQEILTRSGHRFEVVKLGTFCGKPL